MRCQTTGLLHPTQRPERYYLRTVAHVDLNGEGHHCAKSTIFVLYFRADRLTNSGNVYCRNSKHAPMSKRVRITNRPTNVSRKIAAYKLTKTRC